MIIGFSFGLPTFGSWDLAGNQFTVPQILTLPIIHEKNFVLDAMTRPAEIPPELPGNGWNAMDGDPVSTSGYLDSNS